MVFESNSGIRRIFLTLTFWTLFVAILATLAAWLVSIWLPPGYALANAPYPIGEDEIEVLRSDPASSADPAKDSKGRSSLNPDAAERARTIFHTKPFLRTAFVVMDAPESLTDYRAHAADLDAVFPTAFSVSTPDGKLLRTVPDTVNKQSFGAHNLVLPVISDTDAQGNWHPWELALLLDNRKVSDGLIQQLLSEVKRMHADGINVDFEQLAEVERDNLSFWLKHLCEAFHAEHLLVTVDAPLRDQAFDYEYIGEVADAVVAMAYDEHYPGGNPGSIAGQEWLRGGVDEIAERVPAHKLLVAMGAYGYDWNKTGKAPAESLSFADSMRLAATKHAKVTASGAEMNSHFSYVDEGGGHHEVWLLDAVSAWNQIQIVRDKHLRGYSLWRTGMEDQGVWSFLGASDIPTTLPDQLKSIQTDQSVEFVGKGELFHVSSVAEEGVRELIFNGNMVTRADYRSLPQFAQVRKFGHAEGKFVSLTFDDGPDPVWTPEVLRVLREQGVRATFFLVGDEVEKNPALARQEFTEGHLLGNHTFFHPNLAEVTEGRLRIELNSTQRAIESIVGRGTRLFRPPFDTDTTPLKATQLKSLFQATQLGYNIVGGDVDACDYQRPGTDVIVRNVISGLADTGSNIVVMHDGGGNRQQTIEALRKLIPELKRRGYEFVTLNDLTHSSDAELMPEMNRGEQTIADGYAIVGWIKKKGCTWLSLIFMITTGLAMLRILFLGVMVFRNHRKPASNDPPPRFMPRVTVVIPAYNEAKVIGRTLESILQSDYPEIKIIVVDDGSRDDTREIVSQYSESRPQVQLLSKYNGGKSSALNAGFWAADTEYVVTIDADTIITGKTIRELIKPLADPGVDAVCGNVQVGNVQNLLTSLQEIEYITMQNFDRRGFDHLNCISVVPGATGAWRRDSVLAVGGFSSETLTEDADLTLTLLATGARIVNAPEARSVTEAPETIRALFKQRFRWSFGTFQCLWKHRGRFGRGALGWFALPNLFVFQLLFPLLSPLGDIVLIWSIACGQFSVVSLWFLLFLALDLAGSITAFYLDNQKLSKLWLVPVQRFCYRQFLYVVALTSLVRAIEGTRQSWNKLERKATVPFPAREACELAET